MTAAPGESAEVRLARIEEMLKAHFDRDDERAKRWEEHDGRIAALERSESRRKGGIAVLSVICTTSAAIGAAIVKFWGTRP